MIVLRTVRRSLHIFEAPHANCKSGCRPRGGLVGSGAVLAGLNAEQILAVANQVQVRSFAAGETLARAGDEVYEFWIVVEGELDSFLTDPRGRENLIGTVRQGETVGEVVILENMRHPSRSLLRRARTARYWQPRRSCCTSG